VLTSAVTYFERDAAGEFLPARDYPARALVSAATHDHVPVAGFWEGRDLEIRRSLGLIADAASLDRARAEREHDRGALVARLQAEGGLIGEPDAASVVRAVHVFLRRTPAAMVADSLDDLALETTPVNVPGTTNRMYPNWSRKMRRPVERIGLPANAPPDATDPAASSHPA
jgi:4-alpha-glucanotransferase